MTIAISVKVHDGVVLAADSASTLIGTLPGGQVGVVNVYNNANKVFNLYKGLPIGAMTWGAGSIGSASMSTLAKDLRQRFTDPVWDEWKLDPRTYTLEHVARKARQFLFDETYVRAFGAGPIKPSLGFMIAGYSSGADLPEVWQIDIDNGNCAEPSCIRGRDLVGINWNGQIEAVTRLVLGCGTALGQALTELGLPNDQIQPALQHIWARLEAPLAMPAMPIQDAIDLAIFLAETANNFSKFTPGPPTVGGPIETAAITKHEGFRWVQRKFYYDPAYNPM